MSSRATIVAAVLLATGACTTPATRPAARCSASGMALQVLGSGGPIPDDARASSGYLIWKDGKSRGLVDAGGGVFLRFGEAGASIADLDFIALTHLHADHAGDLVPLLKGGYFAKRSRALPLFGPSGNARFPAVDAHLRRLLGAPDGPYRYLAGYLEGDGLFAVVPTVVAADEATPTTIHEARGIAVRAVGVRHGTIPALGYRIELGGRSIAFTGDQSARSGAFVELARGADVLVAHHAIPEAATRVRHLHRTPSEIGALAAQAGVGRVVLSHHMQRALADRAGALAAIRRHYQGPVDLADDLGCYPLGEGGGGPHKSKKPRGSLGLLRWAIRDSNPEPMD